MAELKKLLGFFQVTAEEPLLKDAQVTWAELKSTMVVSSMIWWLTQTHDKTRIRKACLNMKKK